MKELFISYMYSLLASTITLQLKDTPGRPTRHLVEPLTRTVCEENTRMCFDLLPLPAIALFAGHQSPIAMTYQNNVIVIALVSVTKCSRFVGLKISNKESESLYIGKLLTHYVLKFFKKKVFRKHLTDQHRNIHVM